MDNTHTNLDINMDNINFVNFNQKCLNMDNTHTNLDINMDTVNFVNFNKKPIIYKYGS